METFFLLCAAVLILCIFSNKISNKLGVPSLLIFMLLGMLFGSDGIFKIDFADFAVAEDICTAALVFIMFYGGYSINWKHARPAAPKALLLSAVGVIMTAGLVSLCCHFLLKFPFAESFLIGSVVSCTDAAAVFSIFRSKNLNLAGDLAPLLEIESGSNDPVAYMLTVIALTIMEGKAVSSLGVVIILELSVGIAVGVLVGIIAPRIIRKFRFYAGGFDSIFMIAVAMVSYALAVVLDGNGFLSVYLTGIIMGNTKMKSKADIIHFLDNITTLAQMAAFFLLGLLSFPSQMMGFLPNTLIIILFLTLVARPLAVFLLTGKKYSIREKIFISWAGLRGASSIIFAIFATVSGIYKGEYVFHIVFGLTILSVVVQGTLLPAVAEKLNLIDNNNDVLTTFNDYQDDASMNLMQIHINEGHGWQNQLIRDVNLPEGSLAMLIRRQDETIIPKGDTRILAGDEVVLNVPAYESVNDIELREITIDKDHPWNGCRIEDLDLEDHVLVAMIKREDRNIIPKGQTKIQEGDVVVVYN